LTSWGFEKIPIFIKKMRKMHFFVIFFKKVLDIIKKVVYNVRADREKGQVPVTEIKNTKHKIHIMSKYNPYVTQETKPTIEEVVRNLQSGTYSVSPDFQREYVWKLPNQNSLIESILLGYALPTFFAYDIEENGKTMTYFSDGQQRLTTLRRFMENKFKFKTDIERLSHLNGKKFKHFGADQWIIAQSCIKIERWVHGTPLSVIKDHYNRINTKGVALTSGAIRRNSLSGPYYDFLKELSNNEDYLSILGSKANTVNKKKLEHEKFCQIWATLLHNKTFYQNTVNYAANPANPDGDLDKHLGHFRDNPEELTEEYKGNLKTKFNNAITIIKSIFGARAFCRPIIENGVWVTENGEPKFSSFNQGIFEVLMYFFSFADKDSVFKNRDTVKAMYYDAIKNDVELLDSIAKGTTTAKSAKIRFNTFYNIFKQCGVVFNEIEG
jgi:hypothetical protein